MGRIVRFSAAAKTSASVPNSTSPSSVDAVGGSMPNSPRSTAASAPAGDCQNPRVASPDGCCASCPAGRPATKKRVSKRRFSASGVIQCVHGRIRSVRITRPRAVSSSGSVTRWSSSAARSRWSSSADGNDAPSASSTPISSNVSRTAAVTSALDRPGSAESGHRAGSGPRQSSSATWSPGSTEPPGKTVSPANADSRVDRTMRYASRPPGASRRRTVVAASRTPETMKAS